jgi:predicted metal-dependent phosphoesterase TrpH
VNRYAAPLVEMVRIVAEAGGVSVLAHAWGRHARESMPESAITELAGLGLAGLEVDHQDHTPADREALRAIAGRLGLVVTGSSDHHGEGKHDHELGCHTTAPEEYERLLELAAAASQRSGRTTPEVITP